jgi:hypothetical protein
MGWREQIVRLALAEDAGDLGDVTSLATIAAEAQATATFLAKADGTLAGVAVANMVFAELDPTIEVEWLKGDGDTVVYGEKFATVRGNGATCVSLSLPTMSCHLQSVQVREWCFGMWAYGRVSVGSRLPCASGFSPFTHAHTRPCTFPTHWHRWR